MVCVWRRDDDGELERVETPPRPGGEPTLGGFERWRTSFWGSDKVRGLGCVMLPLLATQDLWAEGADELEALAGEVNLLKSRVDEFPGGADAYEFRLDNVLHAVAAAKKIEGDAGIVSIS